MDKDSPLTIAADRYTIEEEIGRGGMGVVLKAHDRMLAITVAIKILGKDSTGQGAARLQREATAAGRLSHPNIARVFDFGLTQDSTPYMVMEYLEGESLADLIKREKLLDCKQAVPIFSQIASALRYAHANGVVHRDLKPSNVMLVESATPEPLVKLLDFGVARIVNEDLGLTRTGALIGSPLYMSPEQADGSDCNEASDIYSFGCLMFETLTGEVPFKGSSALQTISMHRNSAPPLITDLISVQRLPNDFVHFVDECLRKVPQNRPASFEAVLERLEFLQNKLENKVLTREQIQHISNQHYKLRLMKFWKSRFGAVAFLSALVLLCFFCFSIFKSEQQRLQEIKTTLKQTQIVPAEKTSEDKLISNTLEKGISFDRHLNLNAVIADESATDETLKEVVGKHISVFTLDHGHFDGSGIKYMEPESTLFVSFANSEIRDANLRLLLPLKKLNRIIINSPHVTDKGVQTVSLIKSVADAGFCSNKITDKSVEYLVALPNLSIVSLNSTSITDGAIPSFAKMKELNQLHLTNTAMSEDMGVKLANAKGLKALSLNGMKKISAKSIAALAQLPLTTLAFEGTTLGDNTFREIAKIKTLTTLVLSETHFNSASIVDLANMPNLEILNLQGSPNMSDELITQLREFKTLKHLNLSKTTITDSQMLKLTRLRNLEILDIYETNIKPEAYELFAETFKRIWNRDCKIKGTWNAIDSG